MTVSLDEMTPVLPTPDAVFVRNHCASAFHKGYELLPDFF